MLHYLKIFSWFLFTFGIVGLGGVAVGLQPGFATPAEAATILALQTVTAAMILWGFRRYRDGRLREKALIYLGWSLIVLLVLCAQLWLNLKS